MGACPKLSIRAAEVAELRLKPGRKEKMTVEKKELPRGEVELKITITKEEYEPFLKRAALEISAGTEIKGFRKGKAPYDIIKQNVGEGKLWEEALELAVQKTLLQALEQEKLVTVGSPKIEVEKLAPGNDVLYKATLSLMPSVELANLDEIKVEKKAVEVSDDEVLKTLDELRKMRGKEIIVEREAKKSDKVIINFIGYLDKVPFEGGEQKNFPMILGDGHFVPGFEDNLVGMKKNEEKEFKVKFPEEYHQKNLAGREVEFKVNMLSVYRIELPELTDELVKGLGHGFESVEKLKSEIKNNLSHEAEHQEKHRLEEEIIDKILEKSKFTDIPELLINTEAKKMADELEHNIAMQGLKFDDYLTQLKKSRAEILLDFAPAAVRRVKGALAMRKVAEVNKIAAMEEEIEAEAQQLVSVYQEEEARKEIQSLEYRGYLRNVLTSRKVMEYLKGKIVK